MQTRIPLLSLTALALSAAPVWAAAGAAVRAGGLPASALVATLQQTEVERPSQSAEAAGSFALVKFDRRSESAALTLEELLPLLEVLEAADPDSYTLSVRYASEGAKKQVVEFGKRLGSQGLDPAELGPAAGEVAGSFVFVKFDRAAERQALSLEQVVKLTDLLSQLDPESYLLDLEYRLESGDRVEASFGEAVEVGELRQTEVERPLTAAEAAGSFVFVKFDRASEQASATSAPVFDTNQTGTSGKVAEASSGEAVEVGELRQTEVERPLTGAEAAGSFVFVKFDRASEQASATVAAVLGTKQTETSGKVAEAGLGEAAGELRQTEVERPLTAAEAAGSFVFVKFDRAAEKREPARDLAVGLGAS